MDHFIGTAAGFAGNAEKDALYLNFTPKEDDGKTPYTVTVKDVPVDGFWSITVYNKDGFFEPPENAISVNKRDGEKERRRNDDGADCGGTPRPRTVSGLCPAGTVLVRFGLGRILDGSWKFPEPVAVR